MNDSEPSQKPIEPPRVKTDLRKPPVREPLEGGSRHTTPHVPPPPATATTNATNGPKRVSPYEPLSEAQVNERRGASPRRTEASTPADKKKDSLAEENRHTTTIAGNDGDEGSPARVPRLNGGSVPPPRCRPQENKGPQEPQKPLREPGAVPSAGPRRVPAETKAAATHTDLTPAPTPETPVQSESSARPQEPTRGQSRMISETPPSPAPTAPPTHHSTHSESRDPATSTCAPMSRPTQPEANRGVDGPGEKQQSAVSSSVRLREPVASSVQPAPAKDETRSGSESVSSTSSPPSTTTNTASGTANTSASVATHPPTLREKQTTQHLNADEPLIQLQQEILVLQTVVKRRQQEGDNIRMRILKASAELATPTRRSPTPSNEAHEIDHLEIQLNNARKRNKRLREHQQFFLKQREASFKLRSIMTAADGLLDDLECIACDVPEPTRGLQAAHGVLSNAIQRSEEAKQRLDASFVSQQEVKAETAELHEACIQSIADAEERYDTALLRKRLTGQGSGVRGRNHSTVGFSGGHRAEDCHSSTIKSHAVKYASRQTTGGGPPYGPSGAGGGSSTADRSVIHWDPITAHSHRMAADL